MNESELMWLLNDLVIGMEQRQEVNNVDYEKEIKKLIWLHNEIYHNKYNQKT